MPSMAPTQNNNSGLMGGIAHFPAPEHKETIAPAAALVNLAPRTLQAKRLDGTGPAFVQLTRRRIGYSLEALRAWVAAQSVKSTAEASVKMEGAA